MVFVVAVLYLSSLFGFYQYIKNKVHVYENIRDEIDVTVKIEENDPICNAIHNVNVSQNLQLLYDICNIIVSQNVIVCCTGDMQSMALLYGIINVYDNDNININVLFINNEPCNKMSDIVENICSQYNINFIRKIIQTNNILHANVEQYIENVRRETINELCVQLHTHNVLEAHTIENKCNYILANMMREQITKQFETIKPFIHMDIDIIKNFVDKYNIPYDATVNNGLLSSTNIFNEFDTVLKIHYPNWRENIINYADNLDDKLIQFETNIETIMNNCTSSDKYGAYYRYNIDATSYDLFSNIVNKLADSNNTPRPPSYVKKEWYEGKQTTHVTWFCDGRYIVYLNRDILTHLEDLRVHLWSLNPLDYTENNNELFRVTIDNNQYNISSSTDDIVDYVGDMIKGIIYIEIRNGNFHIVELFH